MVYQQPPTTETKGRLMAHIRRHPENPKHWQVRYRDPTSKELTKTFRRKTDAEQFLIQVESKKQRGEWINPDRAAIKLVDWSERWLATRSHLKPKTLEGYESLLQIHVLPHFGNSSLDRIEPLAVEEWVALLRQKGLSSSRVRQAHQVLNSILKSAVRNRYLLSNPAEGIPLPPLPRKEMLFLDAAEVQRLAEAAGPHDTLIFTLAYGGLRWGEAVALRRPSINILRSTIEVAESLAEVRGEMIFGPTKNYKRRTVTVPSFLRDRLNGHLIEHGVAGSTDLVFTSAGRVYKHGREAVGGGQPMWHSNFTRSVWRPAVLAAGLPAKLRIHDLRHTAVALMIAAGAHPEMIKRQLGHSSIVVTMDRYGHLFPSENDAIATALDATYRQARADISRT